MSDTVEGAIYLAIFLVLVFAVMRFVGRFTGARYARVMAPLAPIIGGTFRTDSDMYGWLDGVYQNRKIRATMMPDINEGQAFNHTSDARYNAFEISALEVEGVHNWKLSFGQHGFNTILSGEESWRFSCDDAVLLQRLQASNIVAALETFAGAGVRHHPTVVFSAHEKALTHRDNITPLIAPSPQHFHKHLDLVLHLAQTNEQINCAL